MDKKHEEVKEFFNLGSVKDGRFESPILYSRKSDGKAQRWQVFVKLKEGKITEKIVDEKQLPEVPALLNTHSYVIGEKIKDPTAPKTIYKGTNVGRANATTPLTQAIYMARSLYNKQIRRGYAIKIPPEHRTWTLDELIDDGHPKVFPEKIHDYKKQGKKLPDRLYIERKLDGVFMATVYHPRTDVLAYTIQRDPITSVPKIMEQLRPALMAYPGLHLVGELYIHGKTLQEISGHVRRDDPTTKVVLQYHIFDCFYVDQPDWPFTDRHKFLIDNIKPLLTGGHVHIVARKLINKDGVDAEYAKYLEENYEGAVLRSPAGLYKVGIFKQERSYDVQKLKPRPDAEFPIVGYTAGKGNKEGAIIFICKANGKEFTVEPNMPIGERQALYKEMGKKEANGRTHFENHYLNKPYTVNYSILSKDGVPQQPKGKGLRTPGT